LWSQNINLSLRNDKVSWTVHKELRATGLSVRRFAIVADSKDVNQGEHAQASGESSARKDAAVGQLPRRPFTDSENPGSAADCDLLVVD